MKIIIVILISYLIGSIPSGLLLSNYLGEKDVRKHGSGNIGATNVARVLGLKSGIIVALFDIFKGYIAVLVGQTILGVNLSTALLFVAVAAIAGHDWSIFLGFSGGKGVATTFGVILRLYPAAFLIYVLIWIFIVYITKYVSAASILGSISLPITIYFSSYSKENIYFTILLTLFMIYTHRENIKRLYKGEENKINSETFGKSGK